MSKFTEQDLLKVLGLKVGDKIQILTGRYANYTVIIQEYMLRDVFSNKGLEIKELIGQDFKLFPETIVEKLAREIKDKLSSTMTYSGDNDTYSDDIVDEIIADLLKKIEELTNVKTK